MVYGFNEITVMIWVLKKISLKILSPICVKYLVNLVAMNRYLRLSDNPNHLSGRKVNGRWTIHCDTLGFMYAVRTVITRGCSSGWLRSIILNIFFF